MSLADMIENILEILEKNGARTIRKWARTETVCRVVNKEMIHTL